MKTNIEDIKELDLLPVGFPYIATPECKEEDFYQVLKNHMTHCRAKLEKNINNAIKTSSGAIVVFENGTYFNVPVYKTLQEAIELPVASWNKLVWQQICRELFENKDSYTDAESLFRFASEALLMSSYGNEY